MDDLLSEFLTETAENLEVLDVELIAFEKNPNDKKILNNIFRLVHTIKGTCGFLDLPRLEAVAHAAETVLGKFRDGVLTVTPSAVTLILESLDQIKELLTYLEHNASEPKGDDQELITRLNVAAEGGLSDGGSEASGDDQAKTGAVSIEDELEKAFNETEVDASVDMAAPIVEPDSAQSEETPPPPPVKAVASQSSAPQEKSPESSLKNQSIRVSVDILEHLMTMVSELVLTRNQLLQMVRGNEDSEFKVPMQRLSNVTAELQDAVMKTRMQPIGNAWKKLPRIIRDISQDLGKKIELVMQGAETELDRQVLEMIKDPLTHMVRNSCDHGLESLEKRRELGKPDAGQVVLRAYHEGGHIIIEIEDDGQGLDVERIKEKIISKNLVSTTDLETMSEQQIQRFIFNPGFSTAEKVTSVSGRGVGMDVVRNNIEVIGGSVDLRSVAGKGTIFTIKIPLTLAIVSALLVDSGGFKFAIPQLSVVELVRTGAGSEAVIECINKTQLLRLRNRLLPLITLSELLGLGDIKGDAVPRNDESKSIENKTTAKFVVVTQVGPQRFGIIVDNVFDTEEIVVKPVSSILRDLSIYSGNTILGDGSVIMIIDPTGIAARVDSHETEEVENKANNVTQYNKGADTTTLLIFKAGSDEPKAVPLSLITRLEEIAVTDIEFSNGQNLVQYRGRLMPIVHISPGATMKSEGRQPVLVFADGDRSLGLAVDAIIDIVEDTLDIQMASQQPGLIGSAVLKEKATEIIDVSYFLTQHQSNWFDGSQGSDESDPRRILLVDDSAFFRNMMKPLISAAGYDVTTVETASEALALKDKGAAFDLVISDIEMPETDGLALARAIRQDEEWGEVPLLALTSNDSPEDAEKGIAAGFQKYISKTDRSALIEIIHETLTLKGSAA